MVGFSSVHQEAFIDYNKVQIPNHVKRFSPQAHSRSHYDSQERPVVKSAKNQRKVERRIDRIPSEKADVALGPGLCESSFSNLNQFLEFTTPSVLLQYLPKTCLWDQFSTRWKQLEAESIPFFTLGDLWNSFDEWSAYGAGVPLLLKGEESVVQYYVPYLSALQLYTRVDVGCHLNSRRLGEESDVSDSDIRDTSSEASSDGEIDGILNLESGKNCRNLGERLADANCCGAENNSSLSGCWLRNGSHCKPEAVIDEEIWEEQERPGHLRFEYFEHAAPYSRVPLVDKISELSHDFPQLRTLRSVELLPESWLSIAWYPIYRIPTGPTLRDLATCFLTYHSLSTSFKGLQHEAGHLSLQNKRLLSSHVLVDNKLEKASLQAFGLASYKLRGGFWTSFGSSERQMASDLQDCAEFWLKQRCVRHPDFEFFLSHTATGWH
ncbi:hypothetical protein O6H91_07G132800 [Diphasiastrum complanatum]|uniref:Uncharacterized protein n=1 Tax=Diphasiastrum complanatum TaxID=34168 RepID=A0ACC2D9N3_DIPCM|nr:hypothetical protein O6H91_Y428300 [Diphasiastrum complanatum]KAJ7551069.1 hypothetical protein O6H91_07G132800 [Diphasiastrum complanatum]